MICRVCECDESAQSHIHLEIKVPGESEMITYFRRPVPALPTGDPVEDNSSDKTVTASDYPGRFSGQVTGRGILPDYLL